MKESIQDDVNKFLTEKLHNNTAMLLYEQVDEIMNKFKVSRPAAEDLFIEWMRTVRV